jgi:hypothetical protein
MPKIWFTADTHLGHKNIIRHCARPFGSIEEMDASLIATWTRLCARTTTSGTWATSRIGRPKLRPITFVG